MVRVVPGFASAAGTYARPIAPGTQITIDCRGKDVAATVVKGKFYDRKQQAK